ncbi:MAG TPA: LysR family transcriptional regulator [Solirubrobacteraceae bacterium]|jgi:DNA-binding transcriptional LysR family regulator
MLNVGRLRVLREVADHGSFSAAADALSYTQSAVSQQIAALEAEAGVPLLERQARGVTLTGAGQTLLEHTDGILARIQAAEAELAAIAGLRGGELRVASFPTAGATLMPLAIASFRSAYPEIALTLAEGEPHEIAPRLAAGEFDLALLFEFRGTGAADHRSHASRLKRVELLEDPMYLALPREHPLARERTLRLSQLGGEAWIQTSSSSPCARHVVRCCHAAGFEPDVSFESDDYQTIQGLVAAGVGVALIPELALSPAREDIVIRSLSPHPPVRCVTAALPPKTRLIPAASAMLRLLEETAGNYRARPLSRP